MWVDMSYIRFPLEPTATTQMTFSVGTKVEVSGMNSGVCVDGEQACYFPTREGVFLWYLESI